MLEAWDSKVFQFENMENNYLLQKKSLKNSKAFLIFYSERNDKSKSSYYCLGFLKNLLKHYSRVI